MKRDLKKHISNIIFAAFVLVILFVPVAKAKLIQGLMEIGLFKPDVSEDQNLLMQIYQPLNLKMPKEIL